MISGIVTATLLLAFLGITAWAWSAHNRRRFAEAASLPLTDEVPLGIESACCCRGGESQCGDRS